MLFFQLLQGIVRPLKSAHQSSAIERSRSAADVVLQASSQAALNNGSADKVSSDSSRFSSLPSASSRQKMVPKSDSAEPSSRSVRKAAVLSRKAEPDSQTSGTTETNKAVDLNENVITAGQVPQPRAKPSHSRPDETSKKPTLIFEKPPDATIPSLQSSSAEQNATGNSSKQTDETQSEDVSAASTSSRGGTRSWVSSSGYRQKLGSQAASRYQSITSRLYGDSWLSSLGSGTGRRSVCNAAQNASSAPVSADSTDEFQRTLGSSAAKTVTDDTALSDSVPNDAGSEPTASKSALHLVYSCSTSSRSVVEHPSLTSDDGNGDDEETDSNEDNDLDDDDNDDSSSDGMVIIGQAPKHLSDAGREEEDVMRWRQRLVTSPPPRRAAHAPRRCEDVTADVVHGRSAPSHCVTFAGPETPLVESPKSPESLKHVSFDPFTLSLNAALEGELDVLQSLFSEVLLV